MFGMKDWINFYLGMISKEKILILLYSLKKLDDLLIVQIYIDDIIFGTTNEILCQKFTKLMLGEFEMSMMGELTFYFEL